jgi:hypothetical protein
MVRLRRKSAGESTKGSNHWSLASILQIATVAVALISPLLAYVGGREGVKASVDVQRSERESAQDQATRSERARVYPKFLEASNEYFLATQDAASEFARCKTKEPKQPCTAPFDLGSFLKPRADFQGALNDVYVYGSDSAWTTASALSGSLPSGVSNFSVQGFELHADDYTSRFLNFLDVMCKELPTKSRKGCP